MYLEWNQDLANEQEECVELLFLKVGDLDSLLDLDDVGE